MLAGSLMCAEISTRRNCPRRNKTLLRSSTSERKARPVSSTLRGADGTWVSACGKLVTVASCTAVTIAILSSPFTIRPPTDRLLWIRSACIRSEQRNSPLHHHHVHNGPYGDRHAIGKLAHRRRGRRYRRLAGGHGSEQRTVQHGPEVREELAECTPAQCDCQRQHAAGDEAQQRRRRDTPGSEIRADHGHQLHVARARGANKIERQQQREADRD